MRIKNINQCGKFMNIFIIISDIFAKFPHLDVCHKVMWCGKVWL
jgi:hypothetical protein